MHMDEKQKGQELLITVSTTAPGKMSQFQLFSHHNLNQIYRYILYMVLHLGVDTIYEELPN